ncbi:efflux RND transporter permease subunit [Horticoccus sp. 23ND18S-11]|uniref:efflux RND transporter permease subunit n=1 Tax=Horticoccus sp. 23ND18S-11 TaxID=3391832 RepID=UPI0039C92ED2
MSTRPRFRLDDSHFALVVRRPVAILMVTLAVGVFGFVSYQRLALTLMPNMSYPTLTVRTVYPGTAPEDMENVVARPLEQQLGIIPKLVSISSISKASQCDVLLEFQWKTDMDLVAQEVREKIDRIRLPDGAQRPLLLHYDPSLDPILRVGLAGPQSLYELRHLADHEVKRKIESLPGVAAIQIKGGLEEQFLVALEESKLSTLKLDITQIATRLQQGNVNLSGGNLREGQTEYLIRTLNEFRSVEEIGQLIVGRQNNVDIRLRDIATITRFHEDRQVLTRVNGQESVEIEVFKEADANVLVVAATVKEALFGSAEQQAYVENLKNPAAVTAPVPGVKGKAKAGAPPSAKRKQGPLDLAAAARSQAQQVIDRRRLTDFLAYQLPPGATLQLLSDQSVFIKNSIDEVKDNAIFGGLIAIVVLYLFLRNVTQTVIVSLCIPISILATFAPMHMSGITLNIISLGGLALGVGNLVDNAIVVLESVYRCREEGDDAVTAVVRGTSEVAMPVVASTLTTVAVFFPIVFVEGVAGQMFGDMALAVVFSQIASLIAALYLIPMLASLAAGGAAGLAGPEGTTTPWRESGYLRFPPSPQHGTARFAHPWRLGVIVLGRLGFGLAVSVAAIVKGLLVLTAVALWPVIFPLSSVLFPRPHPATAGRWARLQQWAAGDRLGPVQGGRVWPRLLAFAAPGHFAGSAGRIVTWFLARPRGWMPLRLVPAALGLAFQAGRFVVEVAFRVVGTVLQALILMAAQAAIGVFRASVLMLSPGTSAGLHWFERANAWLQNNYPPLLHAALRNRLAVLGGSFAAVVISAVLVLPRVGSDLIPQVHQGEFNLDIVLPIGTPLEKTGEVAARVDQVVLRQTEVARTSLTVGAEEGASTSIEAGEHTAKLTVRMKPDLTAADEIALIDRIRAEFLHTPDMKMEVSYPSLFSFKSPIEVEVRGHELTTLKRMAREAESVLSTAVPGLVDIRSSLQSGHPEIQVIYNRDRLAELNLSLRNVADLVRNKVQGRVATEFRQDDQLIDIVVRLREEDRFGLEELRRLIVNPNGVVPVTLDSVATLTINEGPSEIRRVDQQRTALITGNIRGSDLSTVSRDIVTAMETITFPPGFSYALAGQNQEMKTSLNSLLLAFGLAVFLVYIVMASQFESLVQPLLIMTTVPLAMIGVVLVLWLAAIPVTIMVYLGLILLVGIVVNNAIVLIDYINTLRGRGVAKVEAIVEAGRARLRPILMTALTTIVGLIPMALGIGEGAEIRAPMAITVIVGLSTATLLTLVVIPTLYYQFTSNRPVVIPGSGTVAGEPQPEPFAK